MNKYKIELNHFYDHSNIQNVLEQSNLKNKIMYFKMFNNVLKMLLFKKNNHM